MFSSNHRILIMTKPSSAINKNIGLAVYLLFLATGASGLVYQVVWQRYLLNIFGSTIYSISTVLAAFMGGLALGSVLMGVLVPRIRRCLPIYGLLEIVVGISALLIPPFLGIIPEFLSGMERLSFDNSNEWILPYFRIVWSDV